MKESSFLRGFKQSNKGYGNYHGFTRLTVKWNKMNTNDHWVIPGVILSIPVHNVTIILFLQVQSKGIK